MIHEEAWIIGVSSWALQGGGPLNKRKGRNIQVKELFHKSPRMYGVMYLYLHLEKTTSKQTPSFEDKTEKNPQKYWTPVVSSSFHRRGVGSLGFFPNPGRHPGE